VLPKGMTHLVGASPDGKRALARDAQERLLWARMP
jgi:hypothetical protein